MNYNIIDYFENNKKLNGKKMSRLYFRSKHESGWPGNVLIETSDGKCIILPKEERMKVKDYFVPERCLYCLDKLNMFADISVGDNYTGEFSDKKGCNSVIVRTKKGKAAIEKFEGYFEFTETSVDSIKKCQHLEKRKDNLRYEYLKSKKIDRQINKTDFNLTNVKLKHRISYIIKVFKLRVGAGYNNNHFLLSLCLVWKNLKLFIKKFL